MTSDKAKKGTERAPHRSLLKAMGYTDREIAAPWVGIVNAWNELIPGHIHLDRLAGAAKAGVLAAGGTPMEFPLDRRLRRDRHGPRRHALFASQPRAHRRLGRDHGHGPPLDALVLITNCDKITPGMLMAAARLNIPAVVVSGGPMLAGRRAGRALNLNTVFEAVGAFKDGRMSAAELCEIEDAPARLRLVRRHVHGQQHELPHRGAGHGPAGQRHHPRRPRRQGAAGQGGRRGGHGSSREGDQAAGTS